jgi:hypothetical protein
MNKNFRQIMTGNESWLDDNYESPAIFARRRTEVIRRVPYMIDSRKAMITIFFTGKRLLRFIQGVSHHSEHHETAQLETKTMKIKKFVCWSPLKYRSLITCCHSSN